MEQYFEENKTILERIFGRKKRSINDAADGILNDHSKVIYLMASDNKFLSMYPLDITEEELLVRIVEDISYDIGQNYAGTNQRPEF